MDFAFHLAQDSPRFIPLYTFLYGLISIDYYFILMSVFYLINSSANLIIKHLFKLLYQYSRKKSLPILGIGERPPGAYTNPKIGFLDKFSFEAKLFGMPSGHSQNAWFFCAFGIFYLIDKVYYTDKDKYNSFKINKSIWVFITIIIMLILATFISYSRVANNYHTTQQVILGGLIGVGFGLSSYVLTKYILEGDIMTIKQMLNLKNIKI